jgi:hypothetical protein
MLFALSPALRNGVAIIKAEKSQFTLEVSLPILPVLAETLSAGPCGDLSFICGKRGEPLTKESFRNLFKDACRAAGVPGSAHGVRKIAATRAANAGATVAQLEAIFGWVGGTMAFFIYAQRRQAPSCSRNNRQAGERWRNIYSRTFVSGAGRRRKRQMNPMLFFEDGAVERNRTSTGYAHSALNAARLPIPPRPHGNFQGFSPRKWL